MDAEHSKHWTIAHNSTLVEAQRNNQIKKNKTKNNKREREKYYTYPALRLIQVIQDPALITCASYSHSSCGWGWHYYTPFRSLGQAHPQYPISMAQLGAIVAETHICALVLKA